MPACALACDLRSQVHSLVLFLAFCLFFFLRASGLAVFAVSAAEGVPAALPGCPRGRRMRSLLKAVQRAVSSSLRAPRSAPLSLSCARRGQLPLQLPPLLRDLTQRSPRSLIPGLGDAASAEGDGTQPFAAGLRGDKCLYLAAA